MARKSKKSGSNFNMSGATKNPLWRPQPRRARPRVNFDGNRLHGKTNMLDSPINSLAPAVKQIFPIDCCSVASTAVQSVSTNTTIPSNYSEYVYDSVQLEWFPRIGPSHFLAGSQIVGCYLDNPEMVSTSVSETLTSTFNRIRSTKNYFFCNAWERKIFNIPLTRRIKTFNVNTNTAYGDAEMLGRSLQGAVLTVQNNALDPGGSIVLGNWVVSYQLELKNLTNGAT